MTMKTLRRCNRLFGEYLLNLHSADVDPGEWLLGYVVLEGDQTLHRAMRLDGDWRDHRNRPFTKPTTGWYSLDNLDGTPLF